MTVDEPHEAGRLEVKKEPYGGSVPGLCQRVLAFPTSRAGDNLKSPGPAGIGGGDAVVALNQSAAGPGGRRIRGSTAGQKSRATTSSREQTQGSGNGPWQTYQPQRLGPHQPRHHEGLRRGPLWRPNSPAAELRPTRPELKPQNGIEWLEHPRGSNGPNSSQSAGAQASSSSAITTFFCRIIA